MVEAAPQMIMGESELRDLPGLLGCGHDGGEVGPRGCSHGGGNGTLNEWCVDHDNAVRILLFGCDFYAEHCRPEVWDDDDARPIICFAYRRSDEVSTRAQPPVGSARRDADRNRLGAQLRQQLSQTSRQSGAVADQDDTHHGTDGRTMIIYGAAHLIHGHF
jgi:hypothetical protein